ncbi:MAG: cupin domain-containing protein, partial [Pedobacter sp.]
LLELYVLGETDPQETTLVEEMLLLYPEIQEELNSIELAFEKLAIANAVQPDPIIKPFLLATLDLMARLGAGEKLIAPPILSNHSRIEDYLAWIEREDMKAPDDFDEVYAKILNHDQQGITAITWIKTMAPQEVHNNEYERFLILEGSCSIHIEDTVHNLIPGDYLEIPLHKKHHVLVTSAIPCKVILQRIAA